MLAPRRLQALAFAQLLCLPQAVAADADEGARADEGGVGGPEERIAAVLDPLDLTPRWDLLVAGADAAWGAVRVTASLSTTRLFLDGEPLGQGSALRDRVAPGLHVLEARLPSGATRRTNVFVRPGALVETTLRFGGPQGEELFEVVTNAVAIATATVLGSILATQGSVPLDGSMPGLIRAGDAIARGSRQLPRP